MTALEKWTQNKKLIAWIREVEQFCQPKSVHLCDGSKEEYDRLCKELVTKGVFVPLNPEKRPHSFWCHSDPEDVARVEQSTFICSEKQEDAGPTNNWKDPKEMHEHLDKLFKGCMRGRTMYVIPFCMGPIGSSFSITGVQITDSPYVVVSMHIMTHMGKKVMEALADNFFVPCLHSVGVPLKEEEKDSYWPCNPKDRVIVHFPEERSIWSFGSGYGGNALLGKKCLALRIASVMARDQGWMAEHMLIMGVTNPKGVKKYFVAAFPSACGKTNLAMMESKFPGWKVECVGDDIAWMRFGKDGRLYAVNPETGFFGVAPGTSFDSNPNAMRSIAKNTLFTNVALTADKDVWWEGMTKEPPKDLIDWHGEKWTPDAKKPASHPNARFTAPIKQCPVLDPAWDKPEGVPISAIIFGGRRSSLIPLVYESLNWPHGVFIGASVSSELTAAQKGEVGKLRHDPFAMLPFCGYNMGDYFNHWLEIGHQAEEQNLLPRIFHVNWFRKSSTGKFLWPGFMENMRIIQWIFERTEETIPAIESPIGYLPEQSSLNLSGLHLSKEDFKELNAVDIPGFLKEVEGLEEYFYLFGDDLPQQLRKELDNLKERLFTCA